METSATIGLISAAMAKAQGKILAAKKDTDNSFFKSRYADLSSVWEACRSQLSENGVSVVQSPESLEDGGQFDVRVVTLLSHESGEWMKGSLTVPVAKQDAQGIGSAITYARRYALAAMVGVAPDDDDDGNGAVGNGGNQSQQQSRTTMKPQRDNQSARKESSNAPAATQIETFKRVLWSQYACKSALDCDILLQGATGLDHVNISYLTANPDLIDETKAGIELYCKANSIPPAKALETLKQPAESK